MDGSLAFSQQFWGRSMEIQVTGPYTITFPDTGDCFSIRKPSSYVRNLIAGTKYLESVGELVVTNERTGERATIHFKEGGWGGLSSRNKVEGKVVDKAGAVMAELTGRWDESVDRKEGKDRHQRLWTIREYPPHPEKYYGFSQFARELNEVTSIEDGRLPSTDSRLRPDQLAFERGDIAEADRLKQQLEEGQRARRKQREDQGLEPAPPTWFEKDGEGYRYKGSYCEFGTSLVQNSLQVAD